MRGHSIGLGRRPGHRPLSIWPWSKIKRLESELGCKQEFQDALVRHLSQITGSEYVALDERLFQYRPHGMWEIKTVR